VQIFAQLRQRQGASGPSGPGVAVARMARAMADETQIPLEEELSQIGAQLDWVRGYL
jgi:hypothetical protein